MICTAAFVFLYTITCRIHFSTFFLDVKKNPGNGTSLPSPGNQRLFIPSICKPDVYTDVTHHISFFQIHIPDICYGRKLSVIL